jgi:UbiD family decarboxylase
MTVGYKDLRHWISALEAEGDLLRIREEVDWNLEMGEILRRSMIKRGPAILFENIKDYQNTWCRKLFSNGMSSRARVAMMFGMPRDTSYDKLMTLLRQRLREPIEPVTLKAGPVKENIIKGKDVDLSQMPVPLWHPYDGGRYINTWAGTVTRDPDTGELNVGTYRGMIVAKDRISECLLSSQDWGKHFAKYKRMNKPMPIAVVYGWDPSMVFAGSSPFPGDEYKYIGAVRQEPVPLIQCETSDLMVPTSAEIVVEGTMSPDLSTYEQEGPFAEYTGYYGGWGKKGPVLQVSCITHRNDPIFRGNMEGMWQGAPNETGHITFITYVSLMWDILEKQGLASGVVDIVPAPMAIIKIRKSYNGQPRQIAAALWGSKLPTNILRTIIVVEDDVDIHDLRSIQLACHANVDPTKDLFVFPLDLSNPDDAAGSFGPDEFQMGGPKSTRLLVDATIDWATNPKKPEWGNRRRPPKVNEYPDDRIDRLVTSKWKAYGFTT